jgi:hypothetical protein
MFDSCENPFETDEPGTDDDTDAAPGFGLVSGILSGI